MWGKESSGEELDKVIVEEKEKLTKKDKELRLEKEAPCEWGPMYKKIKNSNSRKFESFFWTGRMSYEMGPHK